MEAIVNAASNHLWMDAGAIKRTGGPQIGAGVDHLASTSCIEWVVFVLFDEAGYDVFREHVEKRSSPCGACRML